MRLIDADVLIKNTILNPTHAPYIIRHDVDDEPTVGGWISVKDRLPEENHSVIIAVYDTFACYYFIVIAWLTESGDWDSNDETFNQGDEEVRYWMPLPEPPKEDEQNEVD